MTIKEALQLLELSTPFTKGHLKKAYRDAVMIWHPDRFKGNDDLYARAEARTYRINEAYSLLNRFSESEIAHETAFEAEQATQKQGSRSSSTPYTDKRHTQAPKASHSTSAKRQTESTSRQLVSWWQHVIDSLKEHWAKRSPIWAEQFLLRTKGTLRCVGNILMILMATIAVLFAIVVVTAPSVKERIEPLGRMAFYVWLTCWIRVLLALARSECGDIKKNMINTMLGLFCWPYAFFLGWLQCKTVGLTKFMAIWTASTVVYGASFALANYTSPSSLLLSAHVQDLVKEMRPEDRLVVLSLGGRIGRFLRHFPQDVFVIFWVIAGIAILIGMVLFLRRQVAKR